MEKEKKKFYQKWWFWVIVVIIILVAVSNPSTNTSNTTNENTYQKNAEVEVTIPDFSTMTRDEVSAWFTTNKMNGNIKDDYSDTIEKGGFISQSISANTTAHEGDTLNVVYSLGKAPSKEELNALNKAETYSSTMHMSKKGIYKQLTSDYGEGFTSEAAQYAIDNMQADWNANALAKAKDYQETMSMSKQAIYKQLTSEYGEQFTADEAQYAIDHLDD